MGYHITSGKCWTLKMAKEDETTPGPVYQTQYLRSIQKKVDQTDELRNGTFGADKTKQKTIPERGFQCEYLGNDSPGPTAYVDCGAKVKTRLSVTKHSNKFSVPKVSQSIIFSAQV